MIPKLREGAVFGKCVRSIRGLSTLAGNKLWLACR